MYDENLSPDRRAFLKKTLKILATAMSSFSLVLFAVSSYPGRIRKKKTKFFRVCSSEELPVRGVRQFYIKITQNGNRFTSKVYLVNNGNDTFALSPVCTHLGCLVNWSRHKKRFLCPCHGGQYDMDGNVVEGPPPSNLSRLPMRTENTDVLIGLRV